MSKGHPTSSWQAPEPAHLAEVPALVQALLDHLADEGLRVPPGVPAGDALQRLRILLTLRAPGDLPEGQALALDRVLQHLRTCRHETEALALPIEPGWSELSLWQGDITTLRADAIVNAANARLLGCFQPLHACIDNAIHWQAGPRLRRDCDRLMAAQPGLEPTGSARLTLGYNLPARLVLHTVGPIVRDHSPTARDRADLAASYEACLDLAAAQPDILTLAFCGVSTGVFGYPRPQAARVALATTAAWLARHPGRFARVVFNVFSAQDAAAYRQALDAHPGPMRHQHHE
ncbi:macro domain-containing protein [Pseudaquabacterium rugosum]|uniref:Protein-ADP-ribose hydrolase n=1 Tax=Pseudaquabacterium rugosum TaxID=2984194 RepID=A0ABU9BB43_9BURK